MSDTPRTDAEAIRFTEQFHALPIYGVGLNFARELERELVARRWIPVSENCPAEWERVLAINSAGYMTTTNGMYRTSNGQWHGEDCTAEETHCVISDITHWMALPAPPNRMAEGEGLGK